MKNTLYGSHICGEGGEYETLTLDCPLFKKSIKLCVTTTEPLKFISHLISSKLCSEEVENVIHSDHDFATVAYLRVKNASLVDKPSWTSDIVFPSRRPFLSDSFRAVSEAIIPGPVEWTQTSTDSFVESFNESLIPSSRKVGRWFAIGDIQTTQFSSYSFQKEVQEVFQILQRKICEVIL